MNCPECKGDTERLGQPHFDGSGDRYTYYFCHHCEESYEVIEDDFFGGKPSIKKQ